MHRKVSVVIQSFGIQIWMFVYHVHHASNTQRPHHATHVNLSMRHRTCGSWPPSPVSQCWLLCWSGLHWLLESWCIDVNRTSGLYVNPLKRLRGHFIKRNITPHLPLETDVTAPQSDWSRAGWRSLCTMNYILWQQGISLNMNWTIFNLLHCSAKRCVQFSCSAQVWRTCKEHLTPL